VMDFDSVTHTTFTSSLYPPYMQEVEFLGYLLEKLLFQLSLHISSSGVIRDDQIRHFKTRRSSVDSLFRSKFEPKIRSHTYGLNPRCTSIEIFPSGSGVAHGRRLYSW